VRRGKKPEDIELIDYNQFCKSGISALTPSNLPSRTAPGARRATRRETSRSVIDGFRTAICTSPSGWRRWMHEFRAELAADAALAAASRRTATAATLTPPEESALLIEVARRWGVRGAAVRRRAGAPGQIDTAAREAAIFRMKHFVVRRASKKYPRTSCRRRSGGAARPQSASWRRSFPELRAPAMTS
jgi:hypothetical protein